MSIKPSEITKLLKDQIKNFGEKAEVSEIGKVLSVGDGIARVYGLDNVQAGEMVEFEDGSKGMALNLENDNVGVVIFGDDIKIKEAFDFKQSAQDILITSQLKTAMIINKKIKISNYQVDTYKNKIYIYGIASTSEERDLVVKEAREILDVKDVVASILLVDDLRFNTN